MLSKNSKQLEIAKNKYIDQGYDQYIVDTYLNEFRIIKEKKFREIFNHDLNIAVPSNNRLDISAYNNFHDLEVLVDYIRSQRQIKPKEDVQFDKLPVNQKDADSKIKIYHGENRQSCVYFCKGYPWCIGRNDGTNMYQTYRFRTGEPSFYFVKNYNKPINDAYNYFVVQVLKSENYIVTSSNNDGDRSVDWTGLLGIVPELKGFKQHFKQVPISAEDKEFYNKYKYSMSDQCFPKLSYEDKEKYLELLKVL